jgi:hypothetical protein
MKKFILTLSILFALGLTSNLIANTDSSAISSIITTTGNVIDSTKQAITETVSFVDTSSNFKNIYNDLKGGVAAIAESLKIGAEHVFIVLVKQQVVNAIVYLVLALIGIILAFAAYRQWGLIKYNAKGDLVEVRPVVFTVIFGVLSFILLIITIFNIDTIIMGFVNPEYGAIQDIIKFVRVSTRKGNDNDQMNLLP